MGYRPSYRWIAGLSVKTNFMVSATKMAEYLLSGKTSFEIHFEYEEELANGVDPSKTLYFKAAMVLKRTGSLGLDYDYLQFHSKLFDCKNKINFRSIAKKLAKYLKDDEGLKKDFAKTAAFSIEEMMEHVYWHVKCCLTGHPLNVPEADFEHWYFRNGHHRYEEYCDEQQLISHLRRSRTYFHQLKVRLAQKNITI